VFILAQLGALTCDYLLAISSLDQAAPHAKFVIEPKKQSESPCKTIEVKRLERLTRRDSSSGALPQG